VRLFGSVDGRVDERDIFVMPPFDGILRSRNLVWHSDAIDFHGPGAVASLLLLAGSVVSQAYQPGASAAELHTPGSLSAQSNSPGMVAAQVHIPGVIEAQVV
jgi:hypothetical protein